MAQSHTVAGGGIGLTPRTAFLPGARELCLRAPVAAWSCLTPWARQSPGAGAGPAAARAVFSGEASPCLLASRVSPRAKAFQLLIPAPGPAGTPPDRPADPSAVGAGSLNLHCPRAQLGDTSGARTPTTTPLAPQAPSRQTDLVPTFPAGTARETQVTESREPKRCQEAAAAGGRLRGSEKARPGGGERP